MSEQIQPAPDQTSREHERPEEHERTPGVSHESEAFDFRLILCAGVVLVVIGVLVQVIVSWLLRDFEKIQTAPPSGVSELAEEDTNMPIGKRLENMPGPHLEGIEPENSANSIAAARQRAEARIKRYGWIDPEKEIVHVPIEKAMEQVLRTKELAPAIQNQERKQPENARGKQ